MLFRASRAICGAVYCRVRLTFFLPRSTVKTRKSFETPSSIRIVARLVGAVPPYNAIQRNAGSGGTETDSARAISPSAWTAASKTNLLKIWWGQLARGRSTPSRGCRQEGPRKINESASLMPGRA